MFQQPVAPRFDPMDALLHLLQQQKKREEYHYLAGFITKTGFVGGQVKATEVDARGVVREVTLNVAVFAHCGHRVMSVQDIGFWCACRDVVCPRCVYTCEICLDNFCRKHVQRYNGRIICQWCLPQAQAEDRKREQKEEARAAEARYWEHVRTLPRGSYLEPRALPPAPPPYRSSVLSRLADRLTAAFSNVQDQLTAPLPGTGGGRRMDACPECGTEFEAGRGVCVSCGYEFSYKAGRGATCPRCRKSIVGARCRHCGHVTYF